MEVLFCFTFFIFLFIYTYTCRSLYVVVTWCRGVDGRRRRTTDDDDGTDDDDDDGQISKNISNPCHHIELDTTNPNPISIITCFTKTPKMQKCFRFVWNCCILLIFLKLFCSMYKFHNSYFTFFVIFTILIYLYS